MNRTNWLLAEYKGIPVFVEPSSKWNAVPFHQFKDANGKGLRYAPCCVKAVRTFCVCSQCTECPDHGRICHGTHD